MVQRKLASTLFAFLALFLLGSVPHGVWAQCPQVDINLTIASVSGGTLNSTDQATLNVGGSVTLRLFITRRVGSTSTTTNETTNPNTTFFTSPSRGVFSGPNGSVFTATAADCNLQFPIYARFFDTCTRTTFTDTAHITVRPCPPAVVSAEIGSCPSNQIVTAAAGQCSATATFAAVVTGTPTPTVTFTAPIGPGGSVVPVTSGSTLFPVGTTTVTVTASNTGGTATCTFTVTVQPPTLSVTCPGTQSLTGCTATLPGNLTFPTTNACGTVTLSFGVSGATTGTNLTLAQLLALAFNPGTSTVTVTATTTTGQTATCSFSVVVTRPTLVLTCPGTQNLTASGAACTATLPGNLSLGISGACGTVSLSFSVSGATTGTNLTQAQLFALAFNAGTSTVTVTATTTSGQTATCAFNVVVTPAATLAVTCPVTQTLTGSAANCTATLPGGLTFPTTGACGTVTLSFSVSGATTGTNLTLAQLLALAFNAGTSTVTVTARTTSGQTATCSLSVVVRPPAPTITCPPSFRVCIPQGACTASGVIISPTVTPPCATTTTITAILPGGGTVTVPAGTALPPLPLGLTSITATATNVSGTASCASSVLVLPFGQIEIRASILGVTGAIGSFTSDQVTLHVGGTITLGLTIGAPGCPSFSAVQAGLASFSTNSQVANLGTFNGNVFTAGAGAANKQFPIYARFFNPCTGLTYTATIHVTVRP